MDTITQRRTATLVLTLEQRLAVCKTLSKWQLFNAIANGQQVLINGHTVSIQSITREDGSGCSFNLIVSSNGGSYRCYARTVD